MTTVAQRYAEALLEAVWQEDATQQATTLDELGRLAQCIDDVPELRNALENPSYGKEERRKTFSAVAEKLELSGRVQTFAHLVINRGRAQEFRQINESFKRLYDQRTGRQQGTVYAAQALEETTVNQIREALEQKLGRKLELSVQLDPSLIGGIKTQVGSLVFDGSLRAELERLREKLATAN